MSAAFYIAIENCPADFDPFADGKFLAKEIDTLTTIASQAGCKPLMDFFSQNLEELSDLLGTEDTNAPTEQWFAAQDGLQTVRKLLEFIPAKPNLLKKPDAVLSDLREYENILVEADKRSLRWHLAIDI